MSDIWKEFLDSPQFSEGKKLYKKDLMPHIQQNRNRYTVTLKDDKEYSVSILPAGTKVIDMECSCSEARDIGYCRHEAAFLLELIKRNKIEAYELYPIALELELNQLYSMYADDEGWIEGNLMDAYADRFEILVHNMIPPIIRQKENVTAFEMVKMAFMKLNEIKMYDESIQYELGFMLERYWDTIIHNASESEKDEMYAWFVEMQSMEKTLTCSESISYVLYNSFDDVKYLMIQLDDIRKELNDLDHVENLYGLLNAYRNCLEECHLGLDEYEKWLEEHDEIPDVQSMRLGLLVEKENYLGAIQLVEHYLEKERIRPTGISWKPTLLELYRKTGDIVKQREFLKDILLEKEYMNVYLFDELQSICDEAQWTQFRTSYIQKYPEQGLKVFKDEMTEEEVLKVLEYVSKDVIDAYSLQMMDKYPEQFLHIYTRLLQRMEGTSPKKTLYYEMKKYLLKVEKLPGGRPVAEQFIDR